MRKAISLAFAVAISLVAANGSALADPTADPYVSLSAQPRIPNHVENPGGLFVGICHVDPDGTTPMDLFIRIIGPDGIYYEQNFPGEIDYQLNWQAPDGAPDGIYTYEVEYTSAEGDGAQASRRFIVAGFLTGLCSFKWIDANGNGIYEGGEQPGEGWEMCAVGPVDLGCLDTDQDGLSCWFGITPGEYEVCETLMDGWESTTGGECQTITAVEGEISKTLFGNREIVVPTQDASWGQIKSEYR